MLISSVAIGFSRASVSSEVACASFWTAVQMLEHLGEPAAAARLMRAVEETTGAGIVTPDLGGRATTVEVTKAVCDAIQRG